jgi:hypothetical protein
MMSYVKKDEDADQVMMKLDRTSVFQDGWFAWSKTEHIREL